MKLEQITQAWNEFFFQPQSPLPFAVFRILYGLLVLQCFVIQLLPDFAFWYGPNGIITARSAMQHFWLQPIFDFLSLAGDSQLAMSIFLGCAILAAISLTVGFATRYSALFVFLSLVSLHSHNPMNINGGDCFLRIAGFYLAMSYAGEALSVDRWLKKKFHPDECKEKYWPWAQRMFQIQIAIVYWQTSVSKLAGSQWVDGQAVYYATRLEDMYRFPIPFILDNLTTIQLLTWSTLFIEVALWTLIWVKELRYWVLLAGLCLHLGIDATINLPLFEWAFICSYAVFIEPDDMKKAYKRAREFIQSKLPPAKPQSSMTAATLQAVAPPLVEPQSAETQNSP